MLSNKERKLERLNSGMSDTLSANVYNLILGACVLYGILMNIVLVLTCTDFVLGMNPIVLIIGYFISCIAGSLISRSGNPALSFVGYNLIAVPVGLLLTACIPGYPMEDIILSIGLVAAIVTVMIALSTAFPAFFAKLGGALITTLIITIIVEVISMLLGFHGAIFDYIIVGIFTLYVGYDWHKAQVYPKTIDNAIDSSIDIYMDIINLFLRILRIISRLKSND